MVTSAIEKNGVGKGRGESGVGREGDCNLDGVVRVDLEGVLKTSRKERNKSCPTSTREYKRSG